MSAASRNSERGGSGFVDGAIEVVAFINALAFTCLAFAKHSAALQFVSLGGHFWAAAAVALVTSVLTIWLGVVYCDLPDHAERPWHAVIFLAGVLVVETMVMSNIALFAFAPTSAGLTEWFVVHGSRGLGIAAVLFGASIARAR